MKKYDVGSSLFWLIFSILVCAESLRLGIGTLRNPGISFMTFGASGILGILSLVLFLHAIFKKEKIKIYSIFSETLWRRIILILIALLTYGILMPMAGYLISTFLLMTFCFWILKRQKVWWILILSFLTTNITYYGFKWLGCQFPSGLFDF